MEVASLVPQVFFDLIGRVIPGASIITTAAFLLKGRDATEMIEGIPLTFVVLLGLAFSYLTGALLGAIGTMIQGKEWKDRDVSKFKVELPNDAENGSGIPYMYDAIQHEFPAAGARLAKLRAELHMCRVLITAWIPLLVLHFVANWDELRTLEFWLLVACSVVVLLGALSFANHLQIRARRLLINHWAIMRPGETEPAER